jgi:hypothetical protein
MLAALGVLMLPFKLAVVLLLQLLLLVQGRVRTFFLVR